jgi:hypothetical protein
LINKNSITVVWYFIKMPGFSFLLTLLSGRSRQFACDECENIALPVGYDQQSDEMAGDEEDKNGLYGRNSNAGGCVSDMQPGDEDDP